jgi:hypothetical protein
VTADTLRIYRGRLKGFKTPVAPANHDFSPREPNFDTPQGSFDRLPLLGGKLVAGEPAPTGAWLLSGRVSD